MDFNPESNEWYTPREWVNAARELFGGTIDLDPASHPAANAIVKAAMFYTPREDGTIRRWHGRVWCNPPYSTALVRSFALKAQDEYERGTAVEVLLLVNNATDTAWFVRLAERYPVMLSRGRVRFWRIVNGVATEGKANRQGQAIFYMGPNVHKFKLCFNGLAYTPNGWPVLS